MIYLAALTGLRRGVLLALCFEDINWFQRELMVNKSLARFPAASDGVHKMELENWADEIQEIDSPGSLDGECAPIALCTEAARREKRRRDLCRCKRRLH